jgi:glycosyltransferase involved in cell wall biosynthesis
VLHDPIFTDAAARAAKKAKQSEAVVGIGRLVGVKRYQDLINAFACIVPDFPSLELRLVGDGPCRKDLEKQAADSGVGDRIKFLGMLSDPFPALAGCRAFVSTSGTEGFGMAIVEALASGVPVIAADCPFGPREILNPGSKHDHFLDTRDEMELSPYGILYPVGSVGKLEKALRTLLSNRTLSANYSRKGSFRAADFSIEKSAAEYESLLYPG